MTKHVPTKPLTDYIERKGGPALAFTGIGIRTYNEEDDLELDQTPAEKVRYDRAVQRVKNWTHRGRVPYFSADEFACDLLGTHPADIWTDWYALPAPSVAEVQAAEVEAALVDLAAEVEVEEIERLARVAA